MFTVDDAKQMAKRLRADLEGSGTGLTHSNALELVAHQLGYRDWNTAASRLQPGPDGRAGAAAAVPVLRVTEVAQAYPFYLEHLGFVLDWEHRFAPELPVYAAVRLGSCVLHLSEHYGDGTPGGVCWIPVADVHLLSARLNARAHRFSRPAVDASAPGGPTLAITDPFGNQLRFCQPAPA